MFEKSVNGSLCDPKCSIYALFCPQSNEQCNKMIMRNAFDKYFANALSCIQYAEPCYRVIEPWMFFIIESKEICKL